MSTLQMGHLGINTNVFCYDLTLMVYDIQSCDVRLDTDTSWTLGSIWVWSVEQFLIVQGAPWTTNHSLPWTFVCFF